MDRLLSHEGENQVSKMSNELPVILRVELAKYLDGNRPQRWTKRAGLSVLTSPGGQETGGGD